MFYSAPTPPSAASFSLFQRALLQQEQAPLAELIDEQRFEEVLKKHGVDFGQEEDAVYTPLITLWALLSQVFFADEQRSCKAAVIRVAALWATLNRSVCDTNTGAYCRARQKIPSEAIREITRQLAQEAEAAVRQEACLSATQSNACPTIVTEALSQPVAGRMVLVDGFTVTAADTPENQLEYPQNPAQKPGVGFPILRGVSLISLQTGLLIDVEIGPYSGKESGETALLWKLLDRLQPGDVVVADSYYCTYWLVAACQRRGVQVVMKNHHKRADHPADAQRINGQERLVVWNRPARPEWMSAAEYEQQPESVNIRLVDIQVTQPGFRPESFTVATTLTDHRLCPSAWIGSIYQSRWLAELDIFSIKCSLGMDILRAKTPPMVRTEFWSCLLGYNLIRLKMLQASVACDRHPRGLSFTTTLQLLGNLWLLSTVVGVTDTLAQLAYQVSTSERVGHRPGRVEPRVNKRRPKIIALMTKPRHEYHAMIEHPA